jgi:hypothetical protein
MQVARIYRHEYLMKKNYIHDRASIFLDDPRVWKRLYIVTGGQTGVDRAAFDVALDLKLPARGWVPLDRNAEDGRIKEQYPVQETDTFDPALRTELNAYDSDGTVVISFGIPRDGTGLTEEVARLYNKPLFQIDMEKELDAQDVTHFRSWIDENNIRILNVAGPRESHKKGYIYETSKKSSFACLPCRSK